jgi:hypothetical protein
MTINGVTIPFTNGYYLPKPPEVIRSNGAGAAVSAGYASLTWTWPSMVLGDVNGGFTWWYTTLLAGLPSKTFATASLYNDLWVLTSYTNVVVYRPTFESISGGLFKNVVVEIRHIK